MPERIVTYEMVEEAAEKFEQALIKNGVSEEAAEQIMENELKELVLLSLDIKMKEINDTIRTVIERLEADSQ